MKILLTIIIFALFLIDPIAGLVGLTIVLTGIFGYIFLKAKLEGKEQDPSRNNEKKEEKDDLEWIDRIEEIDAAIDDEE